VSPTPIHNDLLAIAAKSDHEPVSIAEPPLQRGDDGLSRACFAPEATISGEVSSVAATDVMEWRGERSHHADRLVQGGGFEERGRLGSTGGMVGGPLP